MGWTVWGSNPGGGEIFRARPGRPWGHPASYTMGTGSFPGVKQPRHGADHPLPPNAEVKNGFSGTTDTHPYKHRQQDHTSLKSPQPLPTGTPHNNNLVITIT
jgi:hypothetical protein